MHLDDKLVDGLLVDDKLDVTRFDATGRLVGGYDATTRERDRPDRPP